MLGKAEVKPEVFGNNIHMYLFLLYKSKYLLIFFKYVHQKSRYLLQILLFGPKYTHAGHYNVKLELQSYHSKYSRLFNGIQARIWGVKYL